MSKKKVQAEPRVCQQVSAQILSAWLKNAVKIAGYDRHGSIRLIEVGGKIMRALKPRTLTNWIARISQFWKPGVKIPPHMHLNSGFTYP